VPLTLAEIIANERKAAREPAAPDGAPPAPAGAPPAPVVAPPPPGAPLAPPAPAPTGDGMDLGVTEPPPARAMLPGETLAYTRPPPGAVPPPAPQSVADMVAEERRAASQETDLDAKFQAWRTTQENLPAEKGLAIRTIAAVRPDLAPQFIADNLEALQAELKQEELERAMRDSPVLRSYMSDPGRAAYVKDELADASTWEWLFGRWKEVNRPWVPMGGGGRPELVLDVAPAWARAAAGGWTDSITIPRLALKQFLGEATPEDLKELDALEKQQQGRDYGAKNPLSRAIVGAPKMIPYLVGSALFRLIGGTAAGLTTGGAGAAAGTAVPVVGNVAGGVAGGITGVGIGQYAGGAAFDFLENVGPMYRSLAGLKKGDGKTPLLTEAEARSFAVSGSLALAGITSGLAGPLVKRFPIVKTILERAGAQSVEKALVEQTTARAALTALRQYGEHVAIGGAYMAVNGAGQAAVGEIAKGTHGQEASWQPVWDATAHGFVAGIQDMALLAAWGPGRQFLHERGRQVATEHERLQLEAIAEHAKESELLTRSPEQAEELFGKMALSQGAPRVLADPVAWDGYWQKQKVDPRKMAADLADDGGAMYDHVKAGLLPDLSFPIEKWTARLGKTDHLLALKGDVKLSGEARTPRQQIEWEKQQEKLQQALGGVTGNADGPLEQLDGFEHAKFLELLSGRRTVEDAQATAKLFRAALEHLSRTEGMTPAEVLQRWPLRFQGPEKGTTALALAPDAAPRQPPARAAKEPSGQAELALAPRGPAEGRVLTTEAAPAAPAPAPAEHAALEGFGDLPDAVRAAIWDSFRGDTAALAAMSARAKEAVAALGRAGFTDGLVPALGNQKAHEAFLKSEGAKGGVHVVSDMPGLGARNAKPELGQAYGDKALIAYGNAFAASSRAQGGKAHRMSTGDEFYAHFPTQEAADAFLRDLQARLAGPEGTLAPGDQLSTYAGVGTSKEAALAQLVNAKAAAKAKYGDSRKGGAVGHGESFVRRAGDAEPAAPPHGGRALGAQTAVVTPQHPQGERARYAVLEASELIPSHLPDSFQPDPRYPEGVQEREYHRQQEEQVKVVQGAQRLNPALVLSDTPSAVDGPPLVTSGEKALVMGGNGRAMMLARAMREPKTAGAYRAALLEKAGAFGLDKAQVEGMRAPILVRVLEGLKSDAPKEELVAAVRRTNEGMTQVLSPRARAVAEAKNLSHETVQGIGELLGAAGDASLRDVMRDRPAEVVKLLQRDGVINQQNRAQWFAGDALTDEAKDRIEGMFLGRVLGSGDRMAATQPAMLQKLERIAPALVRVQGVNPGLDEVPNVQAAIDLLNDARRRELRVDQILSQGSLFGGADVPPAVAALARLFETGKPKELQERFRAWAHEAAFDPRQATMFAPNPTAEQARAALFRDREVEGVLFQPERPEEAVIRNLVVQHNLTADNLLHADELGGLVVPSIAVAPKESPLSAFGEITLLAPRQLVDPKAKVPIFDADVYSPRHPTTFHGLKTTGVNKLRNLLGPLERETAGYAGDLNAELARKGPKAWEGGQLRPLLELAFAKEKGIAPEAPTKERTLNESQWSKADAVRAFFKAHPEVTDPKSNVEYRSEAFDRELSTAVGDAIRAHFAEQKAQGKNAARLDKLQKELLFAYLGPKGELSANKIDRFLDDARRVDTREVDRDAMEQRTSDAIQSAGLTDVFDAWARERVTTALSGDRHFERYSDGKKRPATLDNLVREMKARGLQGGESDTPGGLGWVRAHGARKFRSLEEIQSDRARLVPPEEMARVKGTLERQWDEIVKAVSPYHEKGMGFGTLDNLAVAIAHSYKKGVSLARELELSGLKDMPADLVKRIEVFAEQLRTTPTEYFEAKPPRAVRLQEFQVAVVPQSVEARVRPTLEKHGLQVEVFDDRGPEGGVKVSDLEQKRGAARAQAIAAAAEKHALLFQGKRGEIRFQVDPKGDVSAFDVTLLEGADESTAAHEVGHWMSLVLGQLASRPEASEINRELYRTALETMGYADHGERQRALVDAQDLRTRDARAAAGKGPVLTLEELERLKAVDAKEERFSHAFELYLAEGKAPTAELGRTFAKFKGWMVKLYRGLQGIQETYRQQFGSELKLSDDVRRMFDRLLGGDEALREADADAAKIEEAVRAMPEQDAAEIRAALTEARRQAEEHLQRVLLADDLRERRQFMSGERERLTEDVAKELDAQPDYQAVRFLKEGRMPEGRTVPPELVTDAGEPRMLDRAEAVARYGAEFVRENLRGLTTSSPEKAAPIDLVAEHFGFQTGDELVRDLAKLPSRGEVIRTRVQEKLQELYGPALLENPQALGEAALDATHTEAQARAVVTGMRILARRLNPDLEARFRAVDTKALERRAREFMGEKPLAEVSVARALSAERKSALDAINLLAKAAKAKDEGTRRQLAGEAFDAHELQLFNHYLWRAARDVREQAGKDVGYLQKFLGDRERAKLGLAGADYLQRVDDLLGSLELRSSRSMAEVARRREINAAAGGDPKVAESMVAWLEQQKALNRDPFVPDRVIENLKRTRHWKEASGEELSEIRETVESIAHLAHVKDTLLTSKGRRERKAILGELSQRLFETFGDNGVVVDRNTLSFKKRALRAVARLKAGVIRPEEFFREADGGDLEGPFTRYLWNPVNDATHRWSELAEKVAKPVLAELEKMPMEDKLRWRHLRFTVKGQPYTMEAALAVALNWGNDSNRSKIVKGWQYGGLEKFGLQAWDGEATAQEFLRHLTKKDWELVDRIGAQLESLWPEMEQLEKKMTGLAPKKVKLQAFEVQTADGQIHKSPGFYYPMVYDRRFSHAGAAQGEKSDLGSFQLYQPGAERGITPHGHLNARVEEFARPVELSLIGLYRHLNHATKDVAMRESLISAYEIVTDSHFRAAIQRTAGEEVLPLLDKWIRDTANDLVVPDGGESMWIQMVNGTRRGLTGSVFAFNAAQALQNLTGVVNAQSRVDHTFMWKGISQVMAERGRAIDWIHEQSAEMKHRARNLDRDVREGLERSLGKTGGIHRAREVAMWAFQASDGVVANAVWLGAYHQAMAGKVRDLAGSAGDHAKAVRWADQTVRLSLTAAATKDLPAIMRSPHAKWFTLFHGWASSRLNDLLGATADAKLDVRDKAYGRAMRRFTRIFFWVMAGAVVSDLAVGKGAQDDDQDGKVDGADWARWMARRAALAPLSFIPLAGPVARAVADGRKDVSLSPIDRVYTGVAQTATAGYRTTKAWLDDDLWQDEARTFGSHFAETAGMAAGLPVGQAKATLGYWLDEDRDPSDTFGEKVLGTTYGKKRQGSLGSALYGE
jgi:hypothetical protein